MKVERKGNDLVITLPFDEVGRDSKSSGKTTIHASTGGAKETGLQVNGKPLQVSVNAYVSKK